MEGPCSTIAGSCGGGGNKRRDIRPAPTHQQQDEQLWVVGPACAPCRKAHAACDRRLPCGRCIAMGSDAARQCQVTPPKKRGRPPTKQLVHAHADTPGEVQDMSPFLSTFSLAPPRAQRSRQSSQRRLPPKPAAPQPQPQPQQPQLPSQRQPMPMPQPQPQPASTRVPLDYSSASSSPDASSPPSSSPSSPSSSSSSLSSSFSLSSSSSSSTSSSQSSSWSLMSAMVADGPALREDFDHYARSQPLPRIPSYAALPPLPVLLRTSIAQAGVPEDGLAVEPCAPPSYQPVPSPPPPPDRWQREQEEFMRAQWEELHRRTIRKRKERAYGLPDDEPYGGRHRNSSGGQQPAAHPPDQQLGPAARQPTMTSTYATDYSPLSGGPWPWPTDSRFGGGSGDDWWPAFHGGSGSRAIPRNPAPLALEHVMPFLADYDFTAVPLVVTTLHQAFIAMQIPEPKDFQGLGLPRVLYTSPGYASLSLFPTEEEVGKLAFSILPDLENMSLLVAHLLIGIPEKPFTVGPVFRCLCYILQKGGNAIQVSCCVQNLYSRRGLVKWQIMVVDGVVGRAATLPPYMGTMQKDDLMRDYLYSRIPHYIRLLDASTSRSSVRATIEQQEPQRHHRPDVYPAHLLWECGRRSKHA